MGIISMEPRSSSHPSNTENLATLSGIRTMQKDRDKLLGISKIPDPIVPILPTPETPPTPIVRKIPEKEVKQDTAQAIHMTLGEIPHKNPTETENNHPISAPLSNTSQDQIIPRVPIFSPYSEVSHETSPGTAFKNPLIPSSVAPEYVVQRSIPSEIVNSAPPPKTGIWIWIVIIVLGFSAGIVAFLIFQRTNTPSRTTPETTSVVFPEAVVVQEQETPATEPSVALSKGRIRLTQDSQISARRQLIDALTILPLSETSYHPVSVFFDGKIEEILSFKTLCDGLQIPLSTSILNTLEDSFELRATKDGSPVFELILPLQKEPEAFALIFAPSNSFALQLLPILNPNIEMNTVLETKLITSDITLSEKDYRVVRTVFGQTILAYTITNSKLIITSGDRALERISQ